MSKHRADLEVDSPSLAAPAYRPAYPLDEIFAAPSAVRTSPATGLVNVADLEGVIDNLLQDRLAHFIADIERRLKMAYEVEAGTGKRMSHAQDINVSRHFIEGYTLTANSPSGGSIAWTNVNIVYNGTNYALTDGNTANKYVWFAMATPTVLQTSNTQPVLATGDTLVFVNNGGTPTSVLEGASGIAPAIGPASVGSTSIIAGAVGTTALADNAATTAKIATGAITSNELGSNAVIAGKVADGAINAAAKIASGVVGATQLATNAVTDVKINAGAVTEAKIGSGAVTNAKIGAAAVNTTQLADGAATAPKIGSGAISPVKLNVLQHFLF